MKEIDEATIARLLDADNKPRAYPIPEQHGPLRRNDTGYRCASRRCGTFTYFKVRGIPYCMIHALNILNDMLIERGVDA